MLKRLWLLASGVLFGSLILTSSSLAQADAAESSEGASWQGAPELEAGDWTLKPRGRVYLDHVDQEVDGGAEIGSVNASGLRTRTARLGLEGDWNDRFRFVAEASLVNGDAEWQDLWVEFAPTETSRMTVGNFKTVSLENLTSSRFTTFMERGPLNEILGVGRTTNLAAAINGEIWTAMVALSGDNINEEDIAGRKTTAVSGRVTFAPVVTESRRVHLGAWARRRDRRDADGFQYQARPNTNYGESYIDTGALGASDTTLGLEAAGVLRNISVQGEYARLAAEPLRDREQADLRALYVFASWFPTGEMRAYEPDTGEFGRVDVLRPVSEGGLGAFELAVRYDHANVIDAVSSLVQAGEYSAVTLGLNWYPFGYARLMANYTVADNDNWGQAFDAEARTFQIRAQFDF